MHPRVGPGKPVSVIATLIWATLAALAIALGWAASFIQARWKRMLALALAPFIPPLTVLAVGLSQGCAGEPGGEACFGYSFGPPVAFALLPGWIVLVVLGTRAKHYVGRLL